MCFKSKRKTIKHRLQWISITLLILPILLTSTTILVSGVYCLVTKNVDDIQNCTILIIDSNRLIDIIYSSCALQIVSNIITIIVLGLVGCRACLHTNQPIVSNKKVTICCFNRKCSDCRCLGEWFIYFAPTILLIIESTLNFGVVKHFWILSVLISVSIFFNSWTSMIIFPLNMSSYKDLLMRGEVNEADYDNVYNETDNNENRKFSNDIKYSCCCWIYNFIPRFTWTPVALFIAFYQNFCWFFYDIIRFTIIITASSNISIVYRRLNMILSFVAIVYRLFHSIGYWNKMLYMDSMYNCLNVNNTVDHFADDDDERYSHEVGVGKGETRVQRYVDIREQQSNISLPSVIHSYTDNPVNKSVNNPVNNLVNSPVNNSVYKTITNNNNNNSSNLVNNRFNSNPLVKLDERDFNEIFKLNKEILCDD